MKRNGKKRIVVSFSIFFVMVFVLALLPQKTIEAKMGDFISMGWFINGDVSKKTNITVEQGQKFYIGDYTLITESELPLEYSNAILEGWYLRKTATMVKASYFSSNKNVAVVNGKGYLTAKKTGTSTIKIKYKGQAVTCKLKVVKAGSFGKKAIVKKLEKASRKLAKAMSSEITEKNGYDLLREDSIFNDWNGGKVNKNISIDGFLMKKENDGIKKTEKLAVPLAGRAMTLYRQLEYFGDKKCPFSSLNSNALKTVSVKATPQKVTITLNRAVTKEDLLGVKIRWWSSWKNERDSEHYHKIWFYNVKDDSVIEMNFCMKEGKKTVTSVPNQEVKLKKGETYKVNYNNSFAWAKEKAVKVK